MAAIWIFFTRSVGSGGIERELLSCVEKIKHILCMVIYIYVAIRKIITFISKFRFLYLAAFGQKISESLLQPQRAFSSFVQ